MQRATLLLSAVVVLTGGCGGAAGAPSPPGPPSPPASGCGASGPGGCYYVDAAVGNDGNPGSSTRPFATLQKAADVLNPGDGVLVRDGIYTGGDMIVNINRSGSAANFIVFRAEHRGGAIIDGQNNTSGTGIEIGGSNVWVEGFEVRNTNHYGIEANGGSHVVVAHNHIHDVGRYCTGTSEGIVGISAYADNLIIEQNLVHDVGRFAPGEQGCNPGNDYWQNHDHGIYQGVGDNLVVRNNVFYNFTHGWAIQRYGSSVDGVYILNNTFAFPNPNKDGQIIIASGTTNLVIANNIFYQPTTAGVWFDGGGFGTVTVSNNLTFGGSVTTGSTLGITYSANLDNTGPKFVNAAGLDFHLQAGSPAIDAGITLTNVTNDFDGVSRPQGPRFDIGAFEFK